MKQPMTVSATLKIKTPINRKDFNTFASQNEIKKKRNLYYYRDCVKIVFSGKEITVSSSLPELLSVSYISKKILRRFEGEYICSPELSLYLPPSLLIKESA